MKRYFKIGEISRLYHIGVDSLRYYEEIGLIQPCRSESGYRLYSLQEIWRLNVIRDLRELGFDMEQIRQYLEEHHVRSTLALLEAEHQAIQEKMHALELLNQNVENRLRTIRAAMDRPTGVYELVEYPPRRCFSIPEGYSGEEEMDVLIKRLLNMELDRLYLIGNNQIGSAISLSDARNGACRNYRSVFVIDENGSQVLEEGTYLSVSYRGSYEQTAQFVPGLFRYAREHGLTPAGDILELLWVDIHISSDRSEHITELQVRVEKEE